jgi:ubiquinone/menaquinone biosynthesis C-methylase UbiE
MNKKYAEKLALGVNKHYSLVAERFSRTRDIPWPEIKFLFDTHIKRDDSVLDLGCGNGRFSEFIENKKKYIGIDNSQELIDIAKKRYPGIDFKKEDALKTSFDNDCFDKIFSVSVLHHLPSHELRFNFLSEANRILKPGGLLIITVWDLSQKSKIKRIAYKNYFLRLIGLSKLDFNDALVDWHGISKCYLHLFTMSEFKKIIQDAGFKLINSGIVRIKDKKSLSNFYVVAQK